MQKMRPIFYLLLATLSWGLTFPLIKSVVASIDPHLFNAVRFSLACLCLLPFLFWSQKEITKAAIQSGLSIGILIFLGYAFQTYGLRYTSGTNSAFITGLLVIFVPLLSWLFYREKIKTPVIWGLICAVIGLFLLAGPESSELNLGDMLTLGSALSFGLQVLFISRLPKSQAGLTFTFFQIFVCAIISWILFLFGSSTKFSYDVVRALPWGSLIFCGIFATACAFYLQTIAQRSLTATHAAFILITEPIWGAIFSYFLAGEVLKLRGYLGMILILAALFVVEMSPQFAAFKARLKKKA